METNNQQQRKFPSSDFLGIPLSHPSLDDFIGDIIELSYDTSKMHRVTYINAHCVNTYFRDKKYAKLLNESDYIYPDGMSIVKAGRELGYSIPERLSAADFFEKFCKEATTSKRKLYFVGSKREEVRLAKERLIKKIPGLEIVGSWHGHFEFGLDEENEILQDIRHHQPDILILGMGVPRQELWAESLKGKVKVPVVWCVGALFEYVSGRRKRAPKWMRQAGFEWLFRLMLEPGRMFKRYVFGNLEFKMHVRKALKKKS